MKKVILIVLMVLMVSTPCMAQTGLNLFSIEGTLWKSIALPHPVEPILFFWGFWGGTAYQGISETGPFLPPASPSSPCTISSSYNDSPLFSTFSFRSSCPREEFSVDASYLGCLFPLAVIGFTAYWGRGIEPPEQREFALYVLLKIDDNWIPPSE